MDTFDVKPASPHDSATSESGGSHQATPTSQRARNVVQTNAIVRTMAPKGSEAPKESPKGSEAPKEPAKGSEAPKQSADAPKRPRLFDTKHLEDQGKEIAACAECGDHGMFNRWMNGELYQYDAEDWTHFLAPLDDKKRAVIRTYMRASCTAGLQEKLRAVLPPQLVFEAVDKKETGKDVRELMVSGDPKTIALQALDIVAACQCGDEGKIYAWLRGGIPNVFTYTSTDWASFLKPLDDAKRAIIRKHLAETCTDTLLDQLRMVLPADLVTIGGRVPREQLEPPKPQVAQHDPGAKSEHGAKSEPSAQVGQPAQAQPKAPSTAPKGKADVLAQIHADRDARAEDLAERFIKAGNSKNLHEVAIVLEGSPILNDPAMRKSFVKAFNTKMNAAIDKDNEFQDIMEDAGFGTAQHTKHVRHVNKPQTVDHIIDQYFKGTEALYLKQLAQDGRSNPLWKVRLALGLVDGKGHADTEVFHLVMEAPGELPRFKISLEEYWTAIKTPLESKIDKPRYARLAALFGMEMAHDAHEEAVENQKEKQAEVGHAGRKVRQLEKIVKQKGGRQNRKDLVIARDHAEDAVFKAQEAEKQAAKKKEAATQQAIVYLASMIDQLKDELNDMKPAAIEEIKEWTREHGDARQAAVAPTSPAFVAITKLKKERDKTYLHKLIKGDADGSVAQRLADQGFDKDDHRADEIVGARAIVEREQAKKGKGKDHTNVKVTLTGLSAEGREQYLSDVSGMKKDQLKERANRHEALAKLSTHLTKLGFKGKEAEELAALFRTEDVGSSYAKLRALVLTTPKAKLTESDFGKAAYKLVLELEGAEYYQVRSDQTMLDALKASTKGKEIAAFLGSATQLHVTPKADHAVVKQARDDAELTPAHWSLALGHELEKLAVPLPRVETRDRDTVFLIAHQAENAARRAEKTSGKTPAAFMQAVKAGLSTGANKTLESHYSKISGAMTKGDPITTDMVLGEVLYHDGKIAGHGATFYHHIDLEHFTQTFEQCEGKELLEQWSNIQEFREGLAAAKQKGKEGEYKSQFVLDARDDRKQLIKDVAGGKSAVVLRKLRERLKEAASHDDEFKHDLDEGGVNTMFHRERMTMRSSLEQAQQRRKGLQMRSISSKGTSDAQRQREVVGGARDAYDDLHEVEDGEEQDKLYREKHQEDLQKNEEGLERTGASFTALRAKVRKYTEIAITIAMMVIATAVAAGITAATFGGGAVTLAPVALMWAKFGIMVAAKLAAVAVGAVIKEAAGNKITGEEWNGRRVGTDIAVGTAGTIAGGVAGTGVGEAISLAHSVSAPAIVELAKVAATAGAKAGSKQLTKWVLERETGEVTILNSLLAVAVTELSSLPAGEIALVVSGELPAHDAEVRVDHDKEAINDQYHEAGLTGHDDAHPGDQIEQLIDHDKEALGGGEGGTPPEGGEGAHEAVNAAHEHVMQAHVLVGVARHGGIYTSHDLESANHHLDIAQGKLELAKADDHAPENVEDTQGHIDEAQEKLDQAQELKEKFEHDEGVAKALTHEVYMRDIGAKPTDMTVEIVLDQVLDKLAEVGEERYNAKKERRAEKHEQVAEIRERQEQSAE